MRLQGDHSLITSWGPLPPFFSSIPSPPLPLHPLALGAGPRTTPPGEDSGPRLGGPARDQAIGNGLVVCRFGPPFIGKGPPASSSSLFPRGGEDRYPGRMVSAATQEKKPFPTETSTGLLATGTSIDDSTHYSRRIRAGFAPSLTQRGLGDMARLL
jgi:hypothetical protein